MAAMEEDLDELRYLIVVDENLYDPEIDDEFDVFDPNDYNFLIYLTEDLQKAMGKELLEKLPDLLEKRNLFENFLASEEDLYGARSELDETGVARAVLKTIEEEMGSSKAS